MSKVPGVLLAHVTVSISGRSESGLNGIGNIAIDARLPNGFHLDIAEIHYQNMDTKRYNELEAIVAEKPYGDESKVLTDAYRRLSLKQAHWLASQIVSTMNVVLSNGIPADDEL